VSTVNVLETSAWGKEVVDREGFAARGLKLVLYFIILFRRQKRFKIVGNEFAIRKYGQGLI
jgi:hypothetical protein